MGRALRPKLDQLGFEYTSDPAQADILIAHSAGCWEVADQNNSKLLVLIGLPLNIHQPVRTLFKSGLMSFQVSASNRRLKKLFWIRLINCHYALLEPRRNYRIIKSAKQQPTKPELQSANVLYIVNAKDPWQRVDAYKKPSKSSNYALIKMAGSHEDIWERPMIYADLINKYV